MISGTCPHCKKVNVDVLFCLVHVYTAHGTRQGLKMAERIRKDVEKGIAARRREAAQ